MRRYAKSSAWSVDRNSGAEIIRQRIATLGWYVLIGTIALIACRSIVWSGYTVADILHASVASLAALDFVTPIEELRRLFGVLGGAHIAGPLAFIAGSPWLFASATVYGNAIQLGLIVGLALGLFSLARLLQPSISGALLSMIFWFCAIAFSRDGDFYTSLVFVNPIAVGCVIAALLLISRLTTAVRERILAVVLFGIGLAIQPSLWPLAIALGIAVYVRPRYARWFVDCIAVCGVAGVFAYSTGFFDGRTIAQFVDTLIASVPLLQRVVVHALPDIPSTTANDFTYLQIPALTLSATLVGLVLAIFGIIAAHRVRDARLGTAVLGVSLWICGAASGVAGTALATFGVALVLTDLVTRLSAGLPQARLTIGGVVAFAAFFTFIGASRINAYERGIADRPWQQFVALQRGAQRGFFAGLPAAADVRFADGSALSVSAAKARDDGRIMYALSERRSPAHRGQIWDLSYEDLPYVGHIARLAYSKSGSRVAGVREYHEFIDIGQLSRYVDSLVAYNPDARATVAELDDTHIVSTIEPRCSEADISRGPSSPGVRWGDGFYHFFKPMPTEFAGAADDVNGSYYQTDPPWRFARANAQLFVRGAACADSWVNLNYTFIAPGHGTVEVAGAVPRVVRAIELAPVSGADRLRIRRGREARIDITSTTPVAGSVTPPMRTESEAMTDVHVLVRMNAVTFAKTGLR